MQIPAGHWVIALVSSSGDPSQPVLEHRPSASITLRYRIVARTNVPPVAGDGNPARPVIVPAWFFAIGNAAGGRIANDPQDDRLRTSARAQRRLSCQSWTA